MSKLAQDVVNYAKTWLNYSEANGKFKEIIDTYNTLNPLPRHYKLKYSDEWCAGFVSACSIKAGTTDVLPCEVSCDKMIQLFKNIGSFVENDGYTPKTGDVIFYDWNDSGVGDNTGSSDHVGIVEHVIGNKITVIEGNKNEKVDRRIIYVNGKHIRGYGVPKYDTSTMDIAAVAHDVIKGKYGNGTERKALLEEKGYDYDAVQKKVNEILDAYIVSDLQLTALACDVIRGLYGNGKERVDTLTRLGYDYQTVQDKVNELLGG